MEQKTVKVYVEVCRKDVIIPKYSRPGDAGMDVYSAEEVMIKPGETVIVPTGLKLAIPDGYEVQVRPRSGISLNTPLRIANSPGTIDSGYRDELGIILANTSANSSAGGQALDILNVESKGNKNGIYRIRRGDRIAQIVLMPVPRIEFELTGSVKDVGQDRGGGFGSTGV